MKYLAAQALTQFSTDPKASALVIGCGRSRRSGSSLKQPTLWFMLTFSCFCPRHPAEETQHVKPVELEFWASHLQLSRGAGQFLAPWFEFSVSALLLFIPSCFPTIPLPYFNSSPEFALDIWINVSSSAAVVACLSESPLLHCTHHKHWLPPLAPGPSLLFSTGRFCYYLPRLLGFLFTRWHGHALTLISKCEINFDEVLKICLQMVLSVLRLKLPLDMQDCWKCVHCLGVLLCTYLLHFSTQKYCGKIWIISR